MVEGMIAAAELLQEDDIGTTEPQGARTNRGNKVCLCACPSPNPPWGQVRAEWRDGGHARR